jgi:hypothetical protein
MVAPLVASAGTAFMAKATDSDSYLNKALKVMLVGFLVVVVLLALFVVVWMFNWWDEITVGLTTGIIGFLNPWDSPADDFDHWLIN